LVPTRRMTARRQQVFFALVKSRESTAAHRCVWQLSNLLVDDVPKTIKVPAHRHTSIWVMFAQTLRNNNGFASGFGFFTTEWSVVFVITCILPVSISPSAYEREDSESRDITGDLYLLPSGDFCHWHFYQQQGCCGHTAF
jgi:hypothetical protein